MAEPVCVLKRGSLSALLVCAACSAPALTEPPADTPKPPPSVSAPVAPPPPAPVAHCEPPGGPSPVCNGVCGPSVLWTRNYGDESGFVPSLVALDTDPEGNLLVAGATGSGPAHLGGRPLYSGWPRSLGEAFVAKYDRTGAHLWSRQLFHPSPAERKNGGRSSAWAMALGGDGRVHAFVSRVLVEQSGTHLVTLSPDGEPMRETWVRKGLPVLVDLTERGGAPSVLGVLSAADGVYELAEHRIEANGSLSYESRGQVPRPPGIVNMALAHWHPRGVLWTAVRTPETAGRAEVGGQAVCPLREARRRKDGVPEATSGGARDVQCTWARTELLAVLIDESGKVEWMRSFEVPGYDPAAEAVSVDAMGNVFWAGPFTGQASFGSHGLCALGLPEGYVDDYFGGSEYDSRCECLRDYADVFVLKLNPSGSPEWVQRIGNAMEDRAGPVVSDAAGNVVIAVRSTRLPDFRVPRHGTPPIAWSLVAFSARGEHLWTHPLSSEVPPVITGGTDGAVYVAETVKAPAGIRLTALQ